MNKLIKFIFFENYFYAICAIALSLEASRQQQIPFNSIIYYLCIFCATIIYYSNAYIHLNDPHHTNPRINWYFIHNKRIKTTQIVLVLLLFIFGIIYLILFPNFRLMFNLYWILLFSIFPMVGLLYYGTSLRSIAKNNLRNKGYFKPLFIGFTWAGIVTVYPILFSSIEQNKPIQFELTNLLLFIKNLMFICVLSIMFDVKDYAADYNKKLKTFVVHFGLRNTIFAILLPLCLIGLSTFFILAYVKGFSIYRVILNTIPFITLLIVSYSLKNRRSILYYLIIIDGLMLIKAICGYIGMMY